MPKKMIDKRGRFNPKICLQKTIRMMMEKLYDLIEKWHAKGKTSWTVPDLIKEMGFFKKMNAKWDSLNAEIVISEYKKLKHRIVHTLQKGRDICKAIRKYRLLEPEYQFIISHFKLLDVTYIKEEAKGTSQWQILNTYERIANIKNRRLTQKILQAQEDLIDLANVEGEILLTHQPAKKALPEVQKFHEKKLIDGVTLKKKDPKLWETKKTKD